MTPGGGPDRPGATIFEGWGGRVLLLKVNGKCKDRREINYFGQLFPRSDNMRFDLATLKNLRFRKKNE